MNFIWLDLETTGLDPAKDVPLAIGMIVTDANFKELARFEETIGWSDDHPAMQAMAPFVRDMHTKNGLLERVRTRGRPMAEVEIHAYWFLLRHLGTPDPEVKGRPPMAGSSVAFDRAFINHHMPDLATCFHYRLLDVTSLKLLATATIPGAQEWNDSRPDAAHTPLADLEASLDELAHWRRELAKPITAHSIEGALEAHMSWYR